jgi:excisionase family DNA binding protein
MSTATHTDDRYLSLADVAKRLSVSVDTLERHIRPALLTGEIASFKIGARRLISWQSLLDYLQRHHNGAVQ